MKAYKRLSILCIAVLLCALLPVLAGATSLGDPPEAVDTNAVYVRANGNDNGAGSQEDPYATLAKAVEKADDGATIYVMSNLEMTECARYYGKDLTITSGEGGPYTVTRSDEFDMLSDNARSWYNPAMIEVGSTEGRGTASLTLTNITFDDDGKKEGEYFIQADSEGDGETVFGKETIGHGKIVQDAIIATYNGTGTITLGEGTVLKNYGGMSAVRLSDGTLIMKAGSTILDDTVTDRSKGTTIQGANIDYYGPAGAVWMQGGTIIMEDGSKICDIVGRAIYNEAGNATINGEINGVQSDPDDNSDKKGDIWWGDSGVVMHMRSEAKATFGSTGKIDGEGVTLSGSGIAVLGGCELTMKEGSVITGYENGSALDIGGTAYLNGEITGLTGSGHAIVAQSSSNHYIRIGETANIHHNRCSYGVIYTQGSNGEIHIYGKINDNISADRGGALVLANNGTHVDAYMYDGAEMCRNVSYQTGGAVMVSCGTFTMKGGTISDNISGAGNVGEEDKVGGGVYVRRGGQFIMNGGTISDNASSNAGGNIAIVTEDYNGGSGYVELNGGTITGGKMDVQLSGSDEEGYTCTGGEGNDIAVTGGNGSMVRYLTVSEDMTLGNPDVYMQKYGFTLVDPQRGTKLGNASKNGEQALTNASTDKGWSDTLIASFWAQADNSQTWVLSGLEKETGKEQLPVYALVMPTDPEGNVADGAKAAVYAVTIDGDTWRFAVPAGGTSGYVVGLVQPTEDYGTLALTVSPTQVTEGEDSHTFQYQAVYTISDSLKNMLDQEPNVGDFTLTFVLDNNLTCTDANDANYDSDTHTLTVTVPADDLLDGYTFHFSAETADGTTLTAGDQLVTSAVLSGQVGTTQVTVPSAPAVVEVVAQTPVTPPVTPSEPADPDDTGVSDLLDTENHNQYLFGYPEGTFGPDQNMTRAEVAQMFYNLLVDKNVAITATFEDVPADAWYAKSVNTLASMGIISGVGENRFEPERSITRAEFTSMAMKFTKGALDGTNVFSDVHSGDWFYEAVVGSIQYGWIEGYEDGTFRPENWITRVEVTSIVNKMLGRFADREFVAGHADELNSFSDVTSTHWGYYHIVEATNSHTYTKPSTNVETWTELK